MSEVGQVTLLEKLSLEKLLFSLIFLQQCENPDETIKPCEAHQNKFPYAKKECSILYSDVFASCRNVVNEYFNELSSLKMFYCVYNTEVNMTHNWVTHWLFRCTT